MKKEGEFGKGFTYCIGLFLKHAENSLLQYGDKLNDYSLWFNGAADHLYELQIPNRFNTITKKHIKDWRDRCISFRLNPATKEDFIREVEIAKETLMLADGFLDVETIKGIYE